MINEHHNSYLFRDCLKTRKSQTDRSIQEKKMKHSLFFCAGEDDVSSNKKMKRPS